MTENTCMLTHQILQYRIFVVVCWLALLFRVTLKTRYQYGKVFIKDPAEPDGNTRVFRALYYFFLCLELVRSFTTWKKTDSYSINIMVTNIIYEYWQFCQNSRLFSKDGRYSYDTILRFFVTIKTNHSLSDSYSYTTVIMTFETSKPSYVANYIQQRGMNVMACQITDITTIYSTGCPVNNKENLEALPIFHWRKYDHLTIFQCWLHRMVSK